jgi:hypothetical protein
MSFCQWVQLCPAHFTEEDCNKYDLIQSAATYPQDNSNYGWLYMDCGSGANWISMGPDYWCARASWAALYSLNSTQGYGSALKTHRCQKAFLGAEMALWSAGHTASAAFKLFESIG